MIFCLLLAIWGHPDSLHCLQAQGICDDILLWYPSCSNCHACITKQALTTEKAWYSFFNSQGLIEVIFLIFITLMLSIISLLIYIFSYQDNPSDKDMNQGTLVIFNLDPSVSNDDLRQIFGVYGEVKEVGSLVFQPHLSLSLLHACAHTHTLASYQFMWNVANFLVA